MKIKSIQKFNLINSIVLISISAWGFADTNSFTALIPAFFGIILLLLGTMLTNEKLVKLSAHLVVLFTLLKWINHTLKKRLISLIKKFTELNLRMRKTKLGGEN